MRFKKSIIALAVLLLTGTFSTVPVFAQTGPEEKCVCEERCEADNINSDCEVCCKNYRVCQGREKEEADEETTEPSPLSPEGNMTLVDDITVDPNDSSKEFFTVTSKDGHYFYIIIDRDSRGNNTVHFLNQVDEADLLGLMEEEDVKAYQAALDAAEKKENSLKSSFVTQQEKKTDEETKENAAEKPAEKKKEKQSGSPLAVGLVLICLMAAAGGIFWYSTHKGKKSDEAEVEDPDADYSEDDEYVLSEDGADGESKEETEADESEDKVNEADVTVDSDDDSV